MFRFRIGAAALLLSLAGSTARAQQASPGAALDVGRTPLDSLVALAQEVNPRVRAAAYAVEAASARVTPAGTLPDPVLAVGVMNLPISSPGFGDMMTMTTVGIDQTLPFPGKLAHAERAAALELEAAQARLTEARLDVAADVRRAYYELAFLDHAFELLERSQHSFVELIEATEARYAVGTGTQQDVLQARVTAARRAEEAVAVAERRRAVLAGLNALLDQPSATPLSAPARVPERIARAAVGDGGASVRFASAVLGARVTDSPLPSLEVLQERSIANNPALRAHESELAAQAARVELARKAHLPDLSLSVQYGERADRVDMLNMMVSVPVPLHRRARQDQHVAEARAELAALEAAHHAMVNQIRAEVADAYTQLERDRAQLALFVRSIIPQGRASLESAISAFQVGRADFQTLLDDQTTLFDYETAYFRALTDFATNLAELQRITGAEVLP